MKHVYHSLNVIDKQINNKIQIIITKYNKLCNVITHMT